MKPHLDMNKIARGLRARRKGHVPAGGGYFGAMQLVADVERRFRVPVGGGRATDPGWTERRLVPLAPRTLERLEALTDGIKTRSGVHLEPMQLAGLLLEKTTEQLSEDAVSDLALKIPRESARTGRRRPAKPAGKSPAARPSPA
jgi:hypothetical protein